jgi:hypothetical protein
VDQIAGAPQIRHGESVRWRTGIAARRYQEQRSVLIVITDAKTDVSDLTLEKHHQQTRNRMLHTNEERFDNRADFTTIESPPATQDELTGTERGTNVVFLHTTMDDGDHFQKILAWTLKSQWQKQNELLREVTASFRSEK